ncbi:XRE family transcriptional regulator [Streptomyces sp. cf386]|uniref:helix-turn-helix domain-containing protein n=1 Tax=Streptomyces sp. cf386 TaxID=1761904 RepID=UPI000B88060C|nr:XRE family transcriptional regulator [Streptomyces sp. cf386]
MTTPSPERARLAATLRELKDRTSLSLVGLAAKTSYSKSSWDRYLNGRTLPPRDAVQKLCRLAGEPEGRCLALWEIAEADGSGRGGGSQCVDSPPLPSRPEVTPPHPQEVPPADGWAGAGGTADAGAVHRSATAMAVLAAVCAVAVGGLATVVLLLPHRDGEPRSSLSPSPSSSPAAPGPRCRGAVCEGRSPMQMKCGAAPTTVAAHRTATGAWMELRYSEECGTSWARMWRTRIGDRIEMTAGERKDPDGSEGHGGPENRGGPVRSAEVQDSVDADSYLYTPMTVADPGTVVRACFRPVAGGEGECFDARVPG